MQELKTVEVGTTVTVARVSDRKLRKELDKLGIMTGSDLTVDRIDEDGTFHVTTFGRERTITPELVNIIGVTEQFKRSPNDIINGAGGCGLRGNMIKREEEMWAEFRRAHAEDAD